MWQFECVLYKIILYVDSKMNSLMRFLYYLCNRWLRHWIWWHYWLWTTQRWNISWHTILTICNNLLLLLCLLLIKINDFHQNIQINFRTEIHRFIRNVFYYYLLLWSNESMLIYNHLCLNNILLTVWMAWTR